MDENARAPWTSPDVVDTCDCAFSCGWRDSSLGSLEAFSEVAVAGLVASALLEKCASKPLLLLLLLFLLSLPVSTAGKTTGVMRALCSDEAPVAVAGVDTREDVAVPAAEEVVEEKAEAEVAEEVEVAGRGGDHSGDAEALSLSIVVVAELGRDDELNIAAGEVAAVGSGVDRDGSAGVAEVETSGDELIVEISLEVATCSFIFSSSKVGCVTMICSLCSSSLSSLLT